MPVIDVNSLEELSRSDDLTRLGISIEPIPEILKDCPLRYASYEKEDDKNYTIECHLLFILAEEEQDDEVVPTEVLDTNVFISVNKDEGTKEYSGTIQITLEDKEKEFTAQFQGEGNNSFAIATTVVSETETETISLPTLINSISASLGGIIPEELEVDIAKNAMLVISNSGTPGVSRKKKFLLGLGSNSHIDLGQIPIVGDEVPEANAQIEFLVALDEFPSEEVETINSLLEELEYPVIIKKSAEAIPQDIKKGVSIAGHINIGETYEKTVFLPLRKKSTPPANPSVSALSTVGNDLRILGENSPITLGENEVWLEVQKNYGPIYFNRVGLLYQDNEIHIAPEVALIQGDFNLLFSDISVSSPLTGFNPSINVNGFQLEYFKEPIEIGGAFLRTKLEEYTEYAGMAVLKLSLKGKGGKPPKALGLSAIGAYADTDDPSFFLYAVLDFPLGGPPEFFVTGLAAGFGYNRKLTVPPIEEVAGFPLVALAITGESDMSTSDVGEQVSGILGDLEGYISVTPGAGFLAIGIKFTTYKIIDCFVLLTLAIHESVEVNLLGIASLSIPPKVGVPKPIGIITLVLKATLSFEEGYISLEAQIQEDNSYIIFPDATLTGSAAIYLGFAGEHEGDFVLSAGGYHPDFEVPSHYPQVASRIGFTAAVGPLSIRAECYLALCTHAVMAGGRLEASCTLSKVDISFTLYLNILMSWKPFYYSLKAAVSVQASWGPFEATVGVTLKIWGPDFGGKAIIDLDLFELELEFGDQSSQDAQAIDWEEFEESFLPASDEVCNIAVSQGLVKEIKESEEDILIINPKEFELVTNSVIPIKDATTGDAETIISGDANTTEFGIRPMAVPSEEITSTHNIKITTNKDEHDVTNDFAFEPITKQFPSGLWSEPDGDEVEKKVVKKPKVNAPKFVDNTLSGFRIVPAEPPPAGNTEYIDVEKLQYDVTPADQAFVWNNIVRFDGISTEEGRNTIKESVVSNKKRDEILTALGFNPTEDVKVSDSIADDFVIAPLVVQ